MTEKDFNVFFPEGTEPDDGAMDQMANVMQHPDAVEGALMADHHKGYSMPIGGVVAYSDAISPTGVGFDIGCGNMAVRTALNLEDFDLGYRMDEDEVIRRRKLYDTFKPFMRLVKKQISFGLGRSRDAEIPMHPLFDKEIWKDISDYFGPELRRKAQDQLGTVGGGNHYVDLLVDEKDGQLWIANHFGSRGLGHTLASGFMARAAGYEFTERVPESEEAVVLPTDEGLGQFYIEAMQLAGDYAYAGRQYVMSQVMGIFGTHSTLSVHNHHNYAWYENGLWVVRKGATPLTRQPAFIGGSMGDVSVIVRGAPNIEDNIAMGNKTVNAVADIGALGSAPHGAGRVMSRTQAAGKFRKFWLCNNRNCGAVMERAVANKQSEFGAFCPECKHRLVKRRMRDPESAKIDWQSVRYSLEQQGTVVLGSGADEAPGVYKDLASVLGAHPNIEVLHTLRPLGVVMSDTDDPYKD